MTHDRHLVDRMRQVIVACGGWNRRSRGALLAWARAEGIDANEFEHLLVRAFGTRVPVDLPSKSLPPTAPSGLTRSRRRWPLAVTACLGVALSVWLGARLLPRIASHRVPATPVAPALVTEKDEPGRSLPPAPVSFPAPPSLAPSAPSGATVAAEPLGERPAGELSRASVQAWQQAYAAGSRAWPSMPVLARDALLESLARWIARGNAADLDALRDAQRQATQSMRSGERLLADAFDAMLAAQVAASPSVSSAIAGDSAFSNSGRPDPARAIDVWATSQVPRLVLNMGAADARERWAAWLAAVASIPSQRERVENAIVAVDAILRGDARLDGQGVAADAVGSLLAVLPTRPEQAGFTAVRDAWIGWLRDARVSSSRLWALGGIWRTRDSSIDASLLPGDRDGPAVRAALAERWMRISAGRSGTDWAPMLAELARPVPRASQARLPDRIEDLLRRVRLARRAESPAAELESGEPVMRPLERPDPAKTVETRWAGRLVDPASDVRQRALREMRATAPPVLAGPDATALAARAIGAASIEERNLAQDVLFGPLASDASMREALAAEVAVCADPRLLTRFLERLVGTDLPSEDAQAVRAAAIVGLLRSRQPEGPARASERAVNRLAGTCAAWSGAADPGFEQADPAEAAWALARRACSEAAAVRPPPEVLPLVQDLAGRERRLSRLVPRGPRGFAAALALFCDARAARLSAQYVAWAQVLRQIADAASQARSRASDAIEQSAISLDAIASMDLLVAGAPITPRPVAEHASVPVPERSTAAAQVELERADALLALPVLDRKRLVAALREAVALDPSVAGQAALALAQAAGDAGERARRFEGACVLGQGAGLPTSLGSGVSEGVALCQLLAWSQRGLVDRLVVAKLTPSVRAALDPFSRAVGMSVEECLTELRQPQSASCRLLSAQMRLAAMHAIDPQAVGWLGAIAAGDLAAVPEGDVAQPWRYAIPEG